VPTTIDPSRQIVLNFQQQRVEADFRHGMLRVREYAESIALDKGETVERAAARIGASARCWPTTWLC